MMRREVEQRRRSDADLDHVRPRLAQAAHERREQPRRRQPAVAADRDTKGLRPRLGALDQHGPECATDRVHDVVGQVAIGDAPDVVLAEDMPGHGDAHAGHKTPFRWPLQGSRGSPLGPGASIRGPTLKA
jgi:hypothetical protein